MGQKASSLKAAELLEHPTVRALCGDGGPTAATAASANGSGEWAALMGFEVPAFSSRRRRLLFHKTAAPACDAVAAASRRTGQFAAWVDATTDELAQACQCLQPGTTAGNGAGPGPGDGGRQGQPAPKRQEKGGAGAADFAKARAGLFVVRTFLAHQIATQRLHDVLVHLERSEEAVQELLNVRLQQTRPGGRAGAAAHDARAVDIDIADAMNQSLNTSSTSTQLSAHDLVGDDPGGDALADARLPGSPYVGGDISDALRSPVPPRPLRQPARHKGLQATMERTAAQEPIRTFRLVEQLFDVLLLPFSAATFEVSVAAVETLIVLLGTQMMDPPTNRNFLLERVSRMGTRSRSAEVTRALLERVLGCDERMVELERPEGIVNDLYSVFSLPFQALSYLVDDSDDEDEELEAEEPEDEGEAGEKSDMLASLCIALYLILAHYRPMNERGRLCSANHYRKALRDCTDADDSAAAGGPLRIGFSRFFDYLALHMKRRETAMLLYLLVHDNRGFAYYLLSRLDDVDQLMLPLCEVLYSSAKAVDEKVYLLLVVLLMLSEEAEFCQCAHELEVQEVPWFQERMLKHITVGDLIVLTMIRIAHFNIRSTRDQYIHRTCLSVLTNMAPHFCNLASSAAQRLVSLASSLAKLYIKKPDEEAIAKMFGSVLGIINACLMDKVRKNPNLVYCLMIEKETLLQLRNQDRFAGELENIHILVTHFSTRLEWTSTSSNTFSVDDVLAVIRAGARQLPDDRLKRLPPLSLHYEEHRHPAEYFVPAAWALALDVTALFPPDLDELVFCLS